MSPTIRRVILSWSIVLAATPVVASAQAPTDSTATLPPDTTTTTAAPLTTAPPPITQSTPVSYLRSDEMGELLSVYPPRSDAEVRRLLDGARSMRKSAGDEVDGSKRIADDADGRVRILKEEIETTKARLAVAKKAKDAGEKTRLEATAKRQMGERRYLENLRAAMRADADRLDAEQEAGKAREKALELELDVARRSAELRAGNPTPAEISGYRSQLKDMLNAQQRAAERGAAASKMRHQVAARRMKQLQSLSKLMK